MPFRPVRAYRDFSGGAKTDDYPNKLTPNFSPNPRGVDFFGTSIKRSPGFSEFGTEPDATDIGKTLFNHRILSDIEVLVKTIGTKVKFYDAVTGTYHLISSATFTNLKRWWFATFNGYLYGGNGTNNFVRWRGSAWSTLNGAILIGATTIDLATGEGVRFPNSGSGMIEGDTFSWSGKSTDQLTGVTGVTANHASGSRVIMEMDSSTYSSNPKGSVGLFFRNRIFVRDDANRNFWYFSKLADNTSPEDDLANFTIAGTGSGDAGFIILPAPIIGGKVFITGGNEPVQVVFCADGISYSITVSDAGGATVGAAVPFKVLGNDLAAPEMIAVTENDLVVIDNKGNMRGLGYGEQSTTLKTIRLSDNIYPSMEVSDFSDGVLRYFNRTVYAIGKQNESGTNNLTVVKETNPDCFGFYDHWLVNDLVEFENELYGLSAINGKVYKMIDGFNADGSVYSTSFPCLQDDLGAPLVLKQLNMIRIFGYITTNGELQFKLFLDETDTPFTFTIFGNDTNITTSLPNVAIGTVVFGQGVFGGSLPGSIQRRSFRATLLVREIPYFYLAQLLVTNTQKDVDFALNECLLFADVAPEELDFTDKYLGQD
jgi:hypothetical protein